MPRECVHYDEILQRFQTINTSNIMILYTRSTPTTNVPFSSIYLYSNLCPFNLKYYVGDKVTKKNDEKGCRQSRVKREGSDDLPCSGGSRPVLMGGPGRGPIVMSDGGGAMVMSDVGGGGGVVCHFIIDADSSFGGAAGGAGLTVTGALAPPLEPPLLPCCLEIHTHKNIYL